MDSPGKHRRWLTPEEAIAYLSDRYAMSYTMNTIYSKSSRGEIPVERPSGHRGPIRFDPDKLDAWARGEWAPEPETEDICTASKRTPEEQEAWEKVRAEEVAKRRAG